MANIRLELITTLNATARKLELSDSYQWGHMGLCNCGFLAQEITSLSKEEIHRRAMLRHGDWSEQLNDYCPTSGLPMDEVIDQLINLGITRNQLKHLERLSDPDVLRELPPDRAFLKHNVKEDVVLYLKTWAGMLERQLLQTITLTDLTQNTNGVVQLTTSAR